MSEPSAQPAPSYADMVARLDEITERVRSRDASLDECLDLLDEAVKLGLDAVGLVDAPQLSAAEQAAAAPTPAPRPGSDSAAPAACE